MASGARRRKAAKKKKEKAAISNGNGEVKVVESDSGGNSSPASQDLELRHNPFGEDEDKDLSLMDGSVESNKDGSLGIQEVDCEVVEISGEAGADNRRKSSFNSCSLKVYTNAPMETVHVVDNVELELQMPENEHPNLVAESESFSDQVKDTHVSQVAESNADVQEKGMHDTGSMPVESLTDSRATQLKSNKHHEKVHPSEAFLDFKESSSETLPLINTDSQKPCEEIIDKQLPLSDVHISNGELLPESSDVHQNADKEPLLPISRPVPKTSWTGCCGLFELFTT